MKKPANFSQAFVLVPILAILLLPLIHQAQTTFKMPTRPYGTVITDYDLDGDNDIIVGCSDPGFSEPDSIAIIFNDGWGNFESQGFGANSGLFIYCEDLTGDGYPDIISRDGDSIFFHENNQSIGIGTGYLIKDTYGNPFIGGIADIDMDGFLDIVNYDITTPWSWGVAYNNGDYTFTDSPFVASNGTNLFLSVGNVNEDDAPDILRTTLGQSKSVYILYNEYPGFEKQNIATADWNRGYILNVNNDNLNDVLLFRVSYFGDFPLVNLINEGDHFQNCDTLIFVNGTDINNICDYNLDGYDDFATTVYQANNQPIEDSVYIYFNDQHCGYTHVQSIYIGDYNWLPTINSGDLNGDGYPELVVQGYSMPTPDYIRILWNDGTGNFIDTNSVYVGQKEIVPTQTVSLYPNPASDFLMVQSAEEEIESLEIFDLNGRIFFTEKYSQGQTKIKLDLQIIGLKPGVYICSIRLKDNTKPIRKIIVN
jgi:hypothetical protein